MKKIIAFMALTVVLLLSACDKKDKELPSRTQEPTTLEIKEIQGTKVEGVDKIIKIDDVTDYHTVDIYSEELLLMQYVPQDNTEALLKLYNIYTGEAVYEYKYATKYYKTTLLLDGGVVLQKGPEYIFLDKELKEVEKLKLDGTDNGNVTKDGKYIYYIDDNKLMKMEISNRETQLLMEDDYLKNAYTTQIISGDGKYMLIKTNEYNILYNTEDNTIRAYPEGVVLDNENVILLYPTELANKMMLIDTTKPRLVNIIDRNEDTYNDYPLSSSVLIKSDMTKLKVYDVVNNVDLYTIDIKEIYSITDAKYMDNGNKMLLRLSAIEENYEGLYIWDLTK